MLEGWVSVQDQRTLVAAVLFGAAIVLCVMAAVWVLRLVYDLTMSALWFGFRWSLCMHVHGEYVPELRATIVELLESDTARMQLIAGLVGGVLALLVIGQRIWLRKTPSGPPSRCQKIGQVVLAQVLFVVAFFVCFAAYDYYGDEIRQTWDNWQVFVARLLAGQSLIGNAQANSSTAVVPADFHDRSSFIIL